MENLCFLMNAWTLQGTKFSKHWLRIFSKLDFFKDLWCSQKKTKWKNESVFEFHINIVLTIILSTFFFRLKLKKCVRPGIKITALIFEFIVFFCFFFDLEPLEDLFFSFFPLFFFPISIGASFAGGLYSEHHLSSFIKWFSFPSMSLNIRNLHWYTIYQMVTEDP